MRMREVIRKQANEPAIPIRVLGVSCLLPNYVILRPDTRNCSTNHRLPLRHIFILFGWVRNPQPAEGKWERVKEQTIPPILLLHHRTTLLHTQAIKWVRPPP